MRVFFSRYIRGVCMVFLLIFLVFFLYYFIVSCIPDQVFLDDCGMGEEDGVFLHVEHDQSAVWVGEKNGDFEVRVAMMAPLFSLNVPALSPPVLKLHTVTVLDGETGAVLSGDSPTEEEITSYVSGDDVLYTRAYRILSPRNQRGTHAVTQLVVALAQGEDYVTADSRINKPSGQVLAEEKLDDDWSIVLYRRQLPPITY